LYCSLFSDLFFGACLLIFAKPIAANVLGVKEVWQSRIWTELSVVFYAALGDSGG